MQSTALHPPNSHTLSGEVIGNVLQRTCLPHRSFFADTLCSETGVPECPKKSLDAFDSNEKSTIEPREHTKYPRPTGIKRSLPLREVNEPDPSIDEEEVEAYHRERRRRNQERYRMRQRKLTENPGAANNKLRDEIEQVNCQRNSPSYGVSTRETMWSVAAEYFRVFRRGLLAPEGVRLDSLRSTMARDLDAGTVRGFEALVSNWKVFTQSFKDVDVQLQRLDQIAEHTTSVTFNKYTLSNLFPHLEQEHLDRRKRRRGAHISDKLLGQRLPMSGSVRFVWDGVESRVLGLISQSDMLSPLLPLLGKLEDISIVFSNAQIRLDGNLVVDK